MRRLQSSFAVAVVVVSPTIVFAQNIPVGTVGPAFRTGFHVGAGGGLQRLSGASDISDQANGFGSWGAQWGMSVAGSYEGRDTLHQASLFGAFDAGYDFRLQSNLVAGIFGSLSFGKVSASARDLGTSGGGFLWFFTNSAATSSVTIDQRLDVGLRAGYLIADSTLFYGLAGYAVADVSTANRFVLSGRSFGFGDFSWPVESRRSEWRSGALVGFGMESLLTDKISIKLEFRHVGYGSVTSRKSILTDDGGPANLTQTISGIAVQDVRAMVSYRF